MPASLSEEPGCGAGLACSGGQCLPCEADSECDDGDPCTADTCETSEGPRLCTHVSAQSDADGDGFGSAACGGDDCDDDDAAAYPGAAQRCGEAADHDCDGIVDDTQGCGSCSGATGLRYLYTIRTPATGLFVIGAPPEDPAGDHELFVAAPGSIQVYRAPASPPAGALAPIGETTYDLGEPLAPQVMGDSTIVANFGSQGQLVYRTADLRAGGAVPLNERPLGVHLGLVSAFVAGTRYGYFSVGASGGTLAIARLSDLPAVGEAFLFAGSEWRPCDSLALAPGAAAGRSECVASEDAESCEARGGSWRAECGDCEDPVACDGAGDPAACEEVGGTWSQRCGCATTWLFGMLGQFLSYAAIDESLPPPSGEELGPLLLMANRGVDYGFGTDVAVDARWIALAQGDEGIVVLDRESVVDPEAELVRHGLPLPLGCTAAECEQAAGIVLVGTDRAVVTTVTNLGEQRSRAYLVDIRAPEAWDYPEGSLPPPEVVDDVLAVADVSDPIARGRDVVVSGSRVYVAAKQQEGQLGVVEVFGLACP